MNTSILVFDDFCDRAAEVRESALASGFGKWSPNAGIIGKETYDGMNFVGKHDLMLLSLTKAMGRPVFPGSMFFRITRPGTEKACVHSDMSHGDWSCIVYLSEHKERSGTGFYRHRKTGMTELPPIEKMRQDGMFDGLVQEMSEGKEQDWEQTDFIRGIFNRALIFSAPMFHSREPRTGLGDSDEEGRMVWVAHFNV